MINYKKLKKASAISCALLIAFYANKWFEQAYLEPSSKQVLMLVIALIFLTIAIYFSLIN